MKIILYIINILILVNLGFSISFYSGDVKIDSIVSHIDISEKKATIKIEYIFSGTDNVKLKFQNAPISSIITYNNVNYTGNEFDFDISKGKIINLYYTKDLTNETLQNFVYNPSILFDSMNNINKVNTHKLNLSTPYKLVNSNKEPILKTEESFFKNYVWNIENEYLTPINLIWSKEKANLNLDRTYKIEGDLLRINLFLENNGDKIENVKLIYSFLPSDYTPITNLDEFKTIKEGNDIRTEWSKEITMLNKNEKLNFEHQLKFDFNQKNLVLRPVLVYINNNLVFLTEDLEVIVIEDIDKNIVLDDKLVNDSFENSKKIFEEIKNNESNSINYSKQDISNENINIPNPDIITETISTIENSSVLPPESSLEELEINKKENVLYSTLIIIVIILIISGVSYYLFMRRKNEI